MNSVFSGQKNVRYSLARARSLYAHRVHLLCGAQTSVPPFSVRQFGQRRRPPSNAFGGELTAALDEGVP